MPRRRRSPATNRTRRTSRSRSPSTPVVSSGSRRRTVPAAQEFSHRITYVQPRSIVCCVISPDDSVNTVALPSLLDRRRGIEEEIVGGRATFASSPVRCLCVVVHDNGLALGFPENEGASRVYYGDNPADRSPLVGKAIVYGLSGMSDDYVDVDSARAE